MNPKKSYEIDINYNLIQSIRLIHALYESDSNLCIHPSNKKKFKSLESFFNIKFNYNKKPDYILDIISSHQEPFVIIGSINRTLLFPHIIINYLRGKWNEKRIYNYSFIGLLTDNRKNILKEWFKLNFENYENELFNKKKPKQLLNIIMNHSTISSIFIGSSNRGRKFPIKSWDTQYYNVLLCSKFILCPSGDFIWSYRFFEAILCGAIPIVEADCTAYKGFRYYMLSDKINSLTYTEEIINHNYKLCLERVSLSSSDINNEIKGIINDL